MDTLKTPAEVEAVIATIKGHMPETYKAIKVKAEQIGKGAFGLVREGLRGVPNRFYAFEGGRVVGTPFTHTEISRDVAQMMCTFGVSHVTVWAELDVQEQAKRQGEQHGTH